MPLLDRNNINKQIKQSYQHLKKGNQSEAQAIFNQIVNQQTIGDINQIIDVNSLVQLGALASQLGEKVAAINIFSELVKMYPDNPVHLDSLAQAYIDNDLLYSAEISLKKAIKLKPDLHLPYIRLGALAITNGNYSEAIELLEKALLLKQNDPDIYRNIVTALTYRGRNEEAYDYAQKLLRLEPDVAKNNYMLGTVLNGLGRFDEATSSFKKAIRLDITFGYSYYDLVCIKKFSEVDNALLKQAEKALQMSMPATQRACIYFSLGKMFNDCQEWNKAFEYYKQGNIIGKPALEDKAAFMIFNKTHKSYNKKLFKQTECLGSRSEVPVFIVGMPRSGTTLIEQVIASHPKGAGAGELTEIDRINKLICPYDNLDHYKQELMKSLNAETLNKHVNAYFKELGFSRENAERIVNKMPDNYLFLGLINILFTKAHIIHVIRSPLDTCLSCYFQFFDTVPWANDLGWISKQYKLYKKAMAYWKKVLPEGKIIEIHYEKFVADPEAQAKKLIENIGLQWDSSCLEFYKQKRTINTASVWQARQPIYTSSSKRWVNYSQHLEVLANELQEYLEDDDIEELKRQGIKLKKKWYSNTFKR